MITMQCSKQPQVKVTSLLASDAVLDRYVLL